MATTQWTGAERSRGLDGRGRRLGRVEVGDVAVGQAFATPRVGVDVTLDAPAVSAAGNGGAVWCEGGDGVRLWWEAAGAGDETIVLIPGRGDSSDVFPTRELRDRFTDAGMRVISFDPRDTGLSGDGGDTYTIPTLADDVVAVLDAAGVSSAHAIGLSMAGMVLVELCRRHSDRVQSLTTISAMSPDPDAGFGEQLFREPSQDPVEGFLAAMGSWDDSDRAWVGRQLDEAAERAPARPEAVERHNQAAFRGAWPELADLADIAVPALILHGELDDSIPIAHAHAFADGLSGATLTVIPGMGHLPRSADWIRIADLVCAHIV